MRGYGECIPRLQQIGIAFDDAIQLRRISMQLHRWHELECGDGNDYASWTIARGFKKNGEFTYDDNGKPYIERHNHSENKARYSPYPDYENGAKRRLAKVMKKYPNLGSYIQTDPRGCALYIYEIGKMTHRLGGIENQYSSVGVAVYK